MVVLLGVGAGQAKHELFWREGNGSSSSPGIGREIEGNSEVVVIVIGFGNNQ